MTQLNLTNSDTALKCNSPQRILFTSTSVKSFSSFPAFVSSFKTAVCHHSAHLLAGPVVGARAADPDALAQGGTHHAVDWADGVGSARVPCHS